MPVLTYLEAIRQGLWEEMERDERVFLLGEDIGVYGGAFKVTEGFLERFGEERVIDTPISEAAIVGAAIGAALVGLRPVVRGPCGGGVHGGPFHSQNVEAYFFHTPGLKIVEPATPYDAKGLIKAAIRDDDPVLYFEHKYLYRRIRGEVPEGDYIVPIGKADVKRPGRDVTILTYGWMLHKSLEAAEIIASEGIEVEVVDLRTLLPLDDETILSSVAKTGRAVIVHEDTRTGGIAGEIAMRLNERIFEYLEAPVVRVTAPDTPIPFSPPLEEFFLPQVEEIVQAVRWVANY